MAIEIRRIFGWKKIRKSNVKFGFVERPVAMNTRPATFMFAALDNPQEAKRSEERECTNRALHVLLLKRTQILQ